MRTVLASLLLMVTATAPTLEEQRNAIHIVVARTDATYAAASLPFSASDLEQTRSIWAWTDKLPPKKFDKTGLLDEKVILRELARSKSRLLLVQVRGWSSAEELASLRVIAAPVDMWGTVPESMLPSFALSREGRVSVPSRDAVRVRVVGKDTGTMWAPVSASSTFADLALRPSSDATIRFRAHDGSVVSKVFATVMSTPRGHSAPTLQAQFATDDRGSLRIPSLPPDVITLVISAEGAAPQAISGTAADLSRTIRLTAAGELKGKFVDEDGEPLEGVSVEAEGWISPAAQAISGGKAVSDANGRWVVSGLPRTQVAIRASSKGRASFRADVSLTEGEADLGDVTLLPSVEMTIEVLDAANRAVANVAVSADNGFQGKTNDRGLMVVTGLAPEEGVTLTLTARGFVENTILLTAPLPKKERVILERAFSVSGRVVDGMGLPVSDAIVLVTIGTRYEREHLGDDGTFAIDVEAGREFELTFESPSAGTISRKESPGQPGELRDLRAVVLSAGLSVKGRIVDSAGVALAGARVWALRPAAGGAVVAWTGGRMVQATSDTEGAFTLRGLPPGPAMLRIDAPDHARAHRNVLVEESVADLGSIELVRGSTVTVKATADDSAIARIDLRGEWLEMDMLAAPMVDGVAHVRNVPPGSYVATVLARRAVVCERRVDVSQDREATVECPARKVTGRVLLGGIPSRGGTLTWTRPGRETAGLIETSHSPLGVPQQRVFGAGHGVVVVQVGPEGSFESDELQPGQWEVGWTSPEGATTPALPVSIPDVSEPRVEVRFDGAALRGRVVDAQGAPISAARVTEVGGSVATITSPAGLFTLTGLAAGEHRLLAVQGTRASRIVRVSIEPGREPPDVVLELEQGEKNVLDVRVLGADGQPRPNAFVFVEAGGAIRILTADGEGRARGAFPLGLPNGARIVVFSANEWAFGVLRLDGEAGSPQSAIIRHVRTGSLQIESRENSDEPVLLFSVAGDLTWMLARVGYLLDLTPRAPLVIQGLPPGSYEVRRGSTSVHVNVTSGSLVSAKLP